jgi:hypothetical protein
VGVGLGVDAVRQLVEALCGAAGALAALGDGCAEAHGSRALERQGVDAAVDAVLQRADGVGGLADAGGAGAHGRGIVVLFHHFSLVWAS